MLNRRRAVARLSQAAEEKTGWPEYYALDAASEAEGERAYLEAILRRRLSRLR